MSEDTLPEARRVFGGRFYGEFPSWYTSDKILVQKIVGSFMIIGCHGILYSRVSKGPPLHGGRCKWFQNFVCNFVSLNFLHLVLSSVGEWWCRTRVMCVELPLEEPITNWHMTTEKQGRKLGHKM